MEAAVTTFAPFSPGGLPAAAKVLILGTATAELVDRSRSLNLEHVSAAALIRQEISRRTPLGLQAERALTRQQPVPDETILAALRRWFWMRKPDAGFVLSDFPATLLQAVVFDEWLEARATSLTAVIAPAVPRVGALTAILDHYRTQGVDVFDDAEVLE